MDEGRKGRCVAKISQGSCMIIRDDHAVQYSGRRSCRNTSAKTQQQDLDRMQRKENDEEIVEIEADSYFVVPLSCFQFNAVNCRDIKLHVICAVPQHNWEKRHNSQTKQASLYLG